MGLIGLALLAICLLLVLNVLLPKLISFADLEHADRDDADSVLNDWRRRIHGEKDLYLPSGVSSLTQLREAAVVEDLTLDKLAKQIYEQGVVDSANEERSKVAVKDLKLDKLAKQIYERVVMNVAKDEPSKTVDHCKLALRARTARLNELVRTADQLVTIAGFQQLRHRGETARKWGVGLGSLATVLIVAAFAWPSSAGPYSEKQVQLSAQGAAHFADTLGQSCNEFTAVVLEDKGDRFYALVRPNESCRSAEVWIDQRDTIKRGPQ